MLTSAMSWQSPETESSLSSNTPSMVMLLKTSRRPCTCVWSWQKTSYDLKRPLRPYHHSQSEQAQHIHLTKQERESLTHHSSKYYKGNVHLVLRTPPQCGTLNRNTRRTNLRWSNTLMPHCLFSACFSVTVPALSLLNFCLCVLLVMLCCPKLLGFPQHNE